MMVKDILVEALMGEATRAQRVVIWRVALLTLLVFHVMWELGWLPGGNTGFVRLTDFADMRRTVEGLEKQQREHHVADLIRNIEAFQERVCMALKNGNREAVNYAAHQRNEHLREHVALTGRELQVPSCKELGLD